MMAGESMGVVFWAASLGESMRIWLLMWQVVWRRRKVRCERAGLAAIGGGCESL